MPTFLLTYFAKPKICQIIFDWLIRLFGFIQVGICGTVFLFSSGVFKGPVFNGAFMYSSFGVVFWVLFKVFIGVPSSFELVFWGRLRVLIGLEASFETCLLLPFFGLFTDSSDWFHTSIVCFSTIPFSFDSLRRSISFCINLACLIRSAFLFPSHL